MTNQPDITDTTARPPRHYLMSLPLALRRIEELEGENARLREMLSLETSMDQGDGAVRRIKAMSTMYDSVKEEIAVLREQQNVAVTRSQRFRDVLLRLAASPCPSASWVRQIVADALEITVEEMEMMLGGGA